MVSLLEIQEMFQITEEELLEKINLLVEASLLRKEKENYCPEFLIADRVEAVQTYEHSKIIGRILADEIKGNWLEIEKKYNMLKISEKYSFDKLSLMLVGSKILDIGTGTGILAMCCANLGYKNIIAIDNDPEAVSAAGANISANNMAGSIDASTTPLDSLSGTFDLVIANIIYNTLVEMAPTINTLMAVNGVLIMAGILAGEQAEKISNVYSQQGIRTVAEKISGEWAALLL